MKSPKEKKDQFRLVFFLKQLHSYTLTFIVCTGLYWTHLPLAHAADSTTDTIDENALGTTATSADTTVTTGTGNGVSAESTSSDGDNGNYTKVEGKDIDPTSKMLFANLALFAATMAAPILLKQCQKAPSVWIYAGSAAVYLANEIGLFTRFQNASDAEMAAYLGRGDEDKQIDSLESAAEQTDKAKGAAKRRALVAKIAAAGFAAATAMALVENYTSWVSAGGCGPSTAFMDQNQTPLKDQLEKDSFGHQQPINPSMLVMNSDNFDFLISYEEQMNYASGDLQSISIDEYHEKRRLSANMINEIPGIKSALMTAAQFALNSFSTIALADDDESSDENSEDEEEESSGINWTGSGAKIITGMLGTGAGLVAMNSAKIGNSQMVKNPLTRAALFGGMAVFAGGAAKEASDAANALSERSSEYRRLADSLRNQVSQNTTNTSGGVSQTISATRSDLDSTGISSGLEATCYTGSSTTSISVDESCACASSNSCKSANLPDISAMPEFAGKSILSDSLKSLKSAGDSVYAGRLEGAESSSSALGANAARISKLRDALVKKINKDNVAAGGDGTYDLDKLEDKFQDQLLKSVNDSFNNLSGAQQAALSSFAPAISDSDDSDADNKKKEETDSSPAVGGTGAIATGSTGGKSNKGGSWDFNFDEDAEKEKGMSEAQALAQAMAQEDEEYVIDGDINDDRNKDIFKIITGRYLKSAYPVIFEEQ